MRIKAITTIALAAISIDTMAQSSIDSANLQAPGPVQPTRKKPLENRPDPLVLVDATDKIAGLYQPDSSTVILKFNDAQILANVTNQFDVNAPFPALGEQSGSTYRWAIVGQTWFLSADCSGPPIPLANSGLRPVAYLQDRSSGVLTAYIGSSGRSVAKPANSYRQAALGGGPFSGQCVTQAPSGGTIQGFDVEQIVNVSQRFAVPLTVQ